MASGTTVPFYRMSDQQRKDFAYRIQNPHEIGAANFGRIVSMIIPKPFNDLSPLTKRYTLPT
jgi:hypothetical protein